MDLLLSPRHWLNFKAGNVMLSLMLAQLRGGCRCVTFFLGAGRTFKACVDLLFSLLTLTELEGRCRSNTFLLMLVQLEGDCRSVTFPLDST